jgi:hypothetical protein
VLKVVIMQGKLVNLVVFYHVFSYTVAGNVCAADSEEFYLAKKTGKLTFIFVVIFPK